MHSKSTCVQLLSNCLSCGCSPWPSGPSSRCSYDTRVQVELTNPILTLQCATCCVGVMPMQPDEGDAYGRETTVLDDVDMTAAPSPDADARGSFARGFGGSSGSGFGRPSGGGFGASSGRMMGTVPMASFARVGSTVYNQSGGGGGASAATEARHSVSTRAHTHKLVLAPPNPRSPRGSPFGFT